MKLRPPGPSYNRQQEADRVRQIEQADRDNHKRGKDIEVGAARLILTDTVTEQRYALRIASGVLGIEPL
ncbi:hypothetical protein [Phaeobacter inhibens]|uniref:hypothetical protein n=1 Tax=Phaeobacter inhibens TaxID=221822 RepID=UPI000C9A5E6B|nr:hypothetical protein [Phaeobacter inhibens]AUQ64431.1 hypothetical protein PhaeoP51_03500 [Phaeobacter inhibens]